MVARSTKKYFGNIRRLGAIGADILAAPRGRSALSSKERGKAKAEAKAGADIRS